MAAVAIAATKVQAYSAQASVVCRLSSVVAFRTRARRATRVAPRGHEPSAIRSRSQKLLARTAADSAIAAAAVELFAEDWCLICCLPADAAGEPGGPLYYKDVLTRFLLEFFYPHDSERECDRTIGSFSHQSGITREQLSLPLASPPSPSGIRGILWVVQSIDLWLVSRPTEGHHEVQRSPPRWPLRKAPRPRRTHRRGLSRLRDRPQLRLRADKLPSPNHCESRDFLEHLECSR